MSYCIKKHASTIFKRASEKIAENESISRFDKANSSIKLAQKKENSSVQKRIDEIRKSIQNTGL